MRMVDTYVQIAVRIPSSIEFGHHFTVYRLVVLQRLLWSDIYLAIDKGISYHFSLRQRYCSD